MVAIEISYEVYDKLKELADKYKKNPTQVVEDLILDRASVSDKKRNLLRRDLAWKKYSKDRFINNPRLDDWKVFIAGYNSGWIEFQLRHKEE